MPTPTSSNPSNAGLGGVSNAPSDGFTTTGSQSKPKASSGLGNKAADTIDQGRQTAAGGLESASSALHERADNLPGGEKVASAAHATADALGSTADYIRENDLQSMMQDVQKLVRNNPGPALLTAAALGFLIARTFSRD